MAVPALCSAITLKGTRCKNRAKHGSVCGVHEKTRKKLAELQANAGRAKVDQGPSKPPADADQQGSAQRHAALANTRTRNSAFDTLAGAGRTELLSLAQERGLGPYPPSTPDENIRDDIAGDVERRTLAASYQAKDVLVEGSSIHFDADPTRPVKVDRVTGISGRYDLTLQPVAARPVGLPGLTRAGYTADLDVGDGEVYRYRYTGLDGKPRFGYLQAQDGRLSAVGLDVAEDAMRKRRAAAKPRSKKTNLGALARARSTPKPAHVGKGTHLGALPLADNGSNLAWKGNATADGKFSVEKQNGRWHALDHRTRKAGIKMTGGGVKTKAEAVRHVTEFTAMRGTSDAALMRNARGRADAAQTAARRAAVNEATGQIGGQVAGTQRVAAIGARAAFRAADEQITETNAALAALPPGHRLAPLLDAHREHLTKQREGYRAEAGQHDLQADFDVYGKRRAGHTPASRALMAAERAGVPAVPPGA